MRWIVALLLLGLTPGSGTAQIVPVWRIVTDVTASICPALRDGDVEAAVRVARAYHYRIDETGRPTAPIAGSGQYVLLHGRHFDDLVLAASDGVAWCAITLKQATPGSMEDAAEPQLARLGFRRAPGDAEDRVAWTSETGDAASFPTPRPEPRATLAVRFRYAVDRGSTD
ncbi:MAG: hypothetical protein EON95_21170 [Caulobacteraceae bacterium]|nr:MAG: hypothetical protein EON95_21170 [Caulobacteraceae bacterium]